MKVKLRESQLNKARLITEGREIIDTFITKGDETKEVVNRMYSQLTFTTLAEIIDGNSDLSIMLRKLEQLRTVMYTHKNKVESFFKGLPDEEFETKWEEADTKCDDIFQEVVYHKIDVLEDLIEELNKFAEANIDNNFKDIKKIDL